MKLKHPIRLLAFVSLLSAGAIVVAATGLWRKGLPADQAWKVIKSGGAYDVYMIEATKRFGSADIAADTYKDWAVIHWKSLNTFRASEQQFLTQGLIFNLSREDERWTLDSIDSKDGSSIPNHHDHSTINPEVGARPRAVIPVLRR